jgi:hypothetical protein
MFFLTEPSYVWVLEFLAVELGFSRSSFRLGFLKSRDPLGICIPPNQTSFLLSPKIIHSGFRLQCNSSLCLALTVEIHIHLRHHDKRYSNPPCSTQHSLTIGLCPAGSCHGQVSV